MPDSDELKAYLADRDVPCPGCGYNLRGVAEPVCPECGGAVSYDMFQEQRAGGISLTDYRRGLYTVVVIHGGLLVFALVPLARVAIGSNTEHAEAVVWTSTPLAMACASSGWLVYRSAREATEVPFGAPVRVFMHFLLPIPMFFVSAIALMLFLVVMGW